MRYNEVKITSRSSYQISVAVIERDVNVNVSQPSTTFNSFVTDKYWERTVTETKLLTIIEEHEGYYYSLSANMVGKTELFRIPEFMIGQTYLFSYRISTLFIWCCRLCCFAWSTRVLRGHHATLVFIEKMGALEKLCLRASESLIWHCWRRLQGLILFSDWRLF